VRHPQIIIYETDGALAGAVAELAGEHQWLTREARNMDDCLDLLRDHRPSVLLLKLERRLIDELRLLERVNREVPDCAVVVVSDVKGESAGALAALARDLGARYTLFPPIARSAVEDLVGGLLLAAIERASGANRA
jgi:chemotaxis response regulator CheB